MTKDQPPPSPPYVGYPMYHPEAPIDWSRHRQTVLQNRKFIVYVTVASALFATAIAFLLTPTYRAETLLAPVTEEKGEGLRTLAGQFGDLAAIAGINIGPAKDRTAEYIAALKSRSLFVTFAREHSLIPVLFAGKWDAQNKRWRDGADAPTESEAFDVWDKEIRWIAQDKRTGLVTVAIEWTDPVLAAKWANDLVKHVNARLRAGAVDEADKSIDYLQRQLPSTNSVEMQQALYRLIEAQAKKKLIATTREEYAFTMIDPAVTPEKRHAPKRTRIVVLGIFLGLFAGIAIAHVVSSRENDERVSNRDRA